MKQCLKCGEYKPTSEFYRHHALSDGLQRRCKRCHIEANRVSRERRREREGSGYSREARREESRLYRERNGEAHRAYVREWKRRNRAKAAAHTAVERAVARGGLVRPERCERCGRDGVVEGHHEDYGAPLEVEWLCVSCHQTHHAQEQAA